MAAQEGVEYCNQPINGPERWGVKGHSALLLGSLGLQKTIAYPLNKRFEMGFAIKKLIDFGIFWLAGVKHNVPKVPQQQEILILGS